MEVGNCTKSIGSVVGMSELIKNSEGREEKSMTNEVTPGLPPVPPLQRMSRSRSSLILDRAIECELRYHHEALGPDGGDIKTLRRTISNRLSAQRSRLKKASYVETLEKNCSDMEKRICALSVQLQADKDKHKVLLQEQEQLQQLVETRTKESELRESEIECNLEEIKRLKERGKTLVNQNLVFEQKVEEALTKLRLGMYQPYITLDFYQKGLQQLGHGSTPSVSEKQSGSSARTTPSTGLVLAMECHDEWKSRAEAKRDDEGINNFINFEDMEMNA